MEVIVDPATETAEDGKLDLLDVGGAVGGAEEETDVLLMPLVKPSSPVTFCCCSTLSSEIGDRLKLTR